MSSLDRIATSPVDAGAVPVGPTSPAHNKPGIESSPQIAATLLWELRQGVTLTPGVGPVGTGFEPLDSILDGGLLAGEVVLLGGQPGCGKTIAGLQWARHINRSGRRVSFVCFEHDESSLLNRLLVQELSLISGMLDSTEHHRIKVLIRDMMLGTVSIEDAYDSSPYIEQSLVNLERFSRNLQLLRGSARNTTAADLADICGTHVHGGGVIFVDYLQKLHAPGAQNFEDRVHRSIEVLKDLAVSHQTTVVAISAAMRPRGVVDRLRLGDLQGSSSLANECDVAILMNEKVNAVSERHLKYDLTQIEAAKRRTVFSIEKNRRGEVDAHVEFLKDFSNYRFDPRGNFMAEALAGQ